MKRILYMVAVLAIYVGNADAQSFNSFLSGASKALESYATSGTVTKDMVVGTWAYQKPAVKLQSSNTLANLGGEAVTSQVGDKLSPYLEKIGIKKGCFSITLTEDGKISTSVLGKVVSGTYTIGEDGKTMNIGYKAQGKTFSTTVSIVGGNLSILFGGEKFMSFVQTIVDKIPSTETIESIKSILKSYDSLLVGFEFSKSTESSAEEGE